MSKPRDDSVWNRLAPERREQLEEWLFDERRGYADVLELARREWRVEGTISSLGRYYRRRAREREVGEMVSTQAAADAINALPLRSAGLREAAVKLVGQAALRAGLERPDALAELISLTQLLLASEDHELRRQRLQLADRNFHYQAVLAARQDLPQFSACLAALQADASLSPAEVCRRLAAVLFPPTQPKSDLAATMEAADSAWHQQRINLLLEVMFPGLDNRDPAASSPPAGQPEAPTH